MNRTGIPTLMVFSNGGGVENEQEPTLNLSPEKIMGIALLQGLNPARIDVSAKAQEYRDVLGSAVREPAKPSFYDLASDLGAGLLAQQGEPLPSIGRGIGLGFQTFKQELDAKNKALEEKLDDIAIQSVGLAIGDKQKAEANYNELLFKQILETLDPDKGTAVTYGKEIDGEMSYKTFGNKELENIAEATAEGYALIKSPLVNIGGDQETGLSEMYKGLGRAQGESEKIYSQDYELAQKSNQLLDSMEVNGAKLPEEAFGLAPLMFEDIRRFLISFGPTRNLPFAEGLADIQSLREPMASVTVNLAMMNVQKTKGPISDTEMKLFISSIPSLAQTKDGFFNTIAIMRQINDFIINFETQRLAERDVYLSQEGASVSGLQAHMRKWETDWRKDNKAFTNDQLEMFKDNALETSKNPDRQALADQAVNYFNNMSVYTEPTTESPDISSLSTEQLQKLLEEEIN